MVSMYEFHVFLQPSLLTEGSLVMTNHGMKGTVHLPQANYLEYFPQFLLDFNKNGFSRNIQDYPCLSNKEDTQCVILVQFENETDIIDTMSLFVQ